MGVETMNISSTLSNSKGVVIVTGAAGFIGKYVALHASMLGYEVYGIGHGFIAEDELNSLGITKFIDSDITTKSLTALDLKPDIVFHCAASASVAFSVSCPALDFTKTVVSTLNVLEYIRITNPSIRLVIPSSAAVYGTALYSPLPVTHPTSPISPYGLHKKFVEEICTQYSNLFGIRSSIVRLFSVYGPGLRKQLFWDACNKLTSNINEFDGSGLEMRDWLHVNDAASLLLAAADHASCPPLILNGGTSVQTSIRYAVNFIADKLPHCPKPLFSGEARTGDPLSLVADISSAQSLGWKPKCMLDAGLIDYVDWFLSLQS